MEAAIGVIIEKILDSTILCICHQSNYVISYNKIMEDLQKEVEELLGTRTNIERQIDYAKRRGEDILENVTKWLEDVEKKTLEAKNFLKKEGKSDVDKDNTDDQNGDHEVMGEEIKKNCLSCSRSNLNPIHRYKSSKKAEKMIKDLKDIREKGALFSQVGELRHVPPVSNNRNFVDFNSRKLIRKQIKEALVSSNVNLIGVYGMGGIGKTTLVKEIVVEAIKENGFESAFLVIGQSNPTVESVRKNICDQLRIQIDDQSTTVQRANLLQKILHNQEKKIVIVLDDVWNDEIKLEDVGIIPVGDDNNNLKIIVTSRSQQVFTDMKVKNVYEVEGLTEEESWNFFKNEVGDQSLKSNIAREVVQKCGDLPIALAAVAKALKNKPLAFWENALTKLENPQNMGIEGVSKETYASLKLSYDCLDLENATLFLLCSVFPDDRNISIDNLSRYAMGLKIFKSIRTLKDTRNSVLASIHTLESNCLLQKSEDGDEYVTMHDVIRDVSIHIASTDNQMCTLSWSKTLMNRDLEEMVCERHTAIFIECRNLPNNLPRRLTVPKLKLLVLDNSHRKDKDNIQVEDFVGVEGLEVLHLNKLHFSLPLSLLINLRTLLLINCQFLENFDMIGGLRSLEILDVSYSNITALPSSIGQLSKLKHLNLNHCKNLKVIPHQVISRLKKLEELLIRESFDKWEVEESDQEMKQFASLSELESLVHLTRLHLSIPYIECVPKEFLKDTMNLKRFRIAFGKGWGPDHELVERFMMERFERILIIKTMGRSRNIALEKCIKKLLMMPEKCHVLKVDARVGVKDILLDLNDNSFDDMRHLELRYSEDVEFLTNKSYGLGESSLAFKMLETIKVWGCKRLKYLFPFSIKEVPSNLSEIIVSDCEMMEAIIIIENEAEREQGEGDANFQFPRLKRLTLRDLPKLKGICGKRGRMESDEEISEIVTEEEVISDTFVSFHSQVSIPNLKQLDITRVYSSGIIWNSLIIEDRHHLTSLVLDSCNCKSLNILWSGIEQLESLIIRNCDLEEIFVDEKSNNPNLEDKIVTMKLSTLELHDLPCLKYIWRFAATIYVNISNLLRIEVQKCPRLTNVFPASVITREMIKVLNLDTLEIKNCELLEEVFETNEKTNARRGGDGEFQGSLIGLFNLPNLKHIWSKDSAEEIRFFLNSQRLHVENCPKLVNIFTSANFIASELQNINMMAEGTSAPKKDKYILDEPRSYSTKLEYLTLYKLPQFMKLYGDSNNLEAVHHGEDYETLSTVSMSSSSLSFQQLVQLKIRSCHGSRNLLDLSTVKTLVNLQSLKLSGCNNMSTVIVESKCKEKEDQEEIVFPKLEELHLSDMPALKMFQSAKCTLSFPRLKKLVIKSCNGMETFSHGTVHTPLLEYIRNDDFYRRFKKN